MYDDDDDDDDCNSIYIYIYIYVCIYTYKYKILPNIHLEVDRFHPWLSNPIFGGNRCVALSGHMMPAYAAATTLTE